MSSRGISRPREDMAGVSFGAEAKDMPDPIDVQRFGQRLRRIREERDVTLEKAAKAGGGK